MAGPWPFGETITRLRTAPGPTGPDGRPVRDDRGQPVPGEVVETDVPGCVVTPRTEPLKVGGAVQQGRDTVIDGYNVYAPSGSDWLTTDQVRIRGLLCGITGEPADWGRSPFTGLAGPVQFQADLVTG